MLYQMIQRRILQKKLLINSKQVYRLKLNKMNNLFKFFFAAVTLAMLLTAYGGDKTAEAIGD